MGVRGTREREDLFAGVQRKDSRQSILEAKV